MGTKRWPLPIVLLLVLALGLGTAGTATAGGLTTRAVKKIAAKVVTRKAATLSVAHAGTAGSADHATTADSAATAARASTATSATTAGNAQTVGGATAAQLQTTAYRYTLTTTAITISHTWTFPALPPGTYLVSWAVRTTGSPSVRIDCALHPAGDTVESASSSTTSTSGNLGRLSAAAVVTTTRAVSLQCSQASGSYSLLNSGFADNTISFVPVDALVVDGTVSGG